MPTRKAALPRTMAIAPAESKESEPSANEDTPRIGDEMEGETQVLDHDAEIYGDTEAINDDEEESERTVVLGEEDERFDEVSTPCNLPSTACLGESGLIKKNFAEVRVASLRASGFTASQKSTPTIKEDQCTEMSINRNTGNTARKLNFEEEISDMRYIFSQEKMQEDALEMVDKFLQVNDVGLSQDFNGGKRVDVKRSPVLAAKGLNTLLKQNGPGSPVFKRRIFDWVDSLEDEGGGDFFTKKRDSIFGNTRISKKSKLEKIAENSSFVPSHEAACEIGQNRGRNLFVRKRDSTLGNTKNSKESMVEEIVGNFKCAPSHEAMYEIGQATQIAAEAMEALCFGPPPNLKDITGNSKNTLSRNQEVRRSARLKSSCKDKLGKTSQRKMKDEMADGKRKPRTRKQTMAHAEKMSGQRSMVNSQNGTDDDGSKANYAYSLGNDQAIPIMNESTEKDTEEREYHGFYPTSAMHTHYSKEISIRKKSAGSRELKRLMGNTGFTPDAISQLKMKGETVDAHGKQHEPVLSKPRTRRRNVVPAEKTPGQRSTVCDQSGTDADGSNGNSVPTPRSDRLIPMMKESAEKSTEERENHTFCTSSALLTPYSKEISLREKSLGSRELKGLTGNTGFTVDARNGYKGEMDTMEKENHAFYPTSALPTLHSKEISRRRSLGSRELKGLMGSTGFAHDASYKSSKRDFGSIRVCLSHHLDEDITKKQKKIMAYMGIHYVNSASEGTHFVADKFIRTRNMLEAMAAGKPVVTSQWLENCRQGRCIVQEWDYILRDKEREMGFSMPDSLSRARQSPLFQGKRVFITPNVKPSRELLVDIVRAAKGQLAERVRRQGIKGRSSNLFENLLVISCEEDKARCIPLMEAGVKVFNAELVLNGIVTQRLDYESYQIFSDPVERTRSRVTGNKPKKRKCS